MAVTESLGDVESPVGILRCTLGAFENINAQLGSFGDASHRVRLLDARAIAIVVAEATGRKVADVKESIWRVGVQALEKPLQKYIVMLSNGGKMPDEGGDKGAAAGEA